MARQCKRTRAFREQKALVYLEVDIAAQPQYIAQLRVLLNESPLADAEPWAWHARERRARRGDTTKEVVWAFAQCVVQHACVCARDALFDARHESGLLLGAPLRLGLLPCGRERCVRQWGPHRVSLRNAWTPRAGVAVANAALQGEAHVRTPLGGGQLCALRLSARPRNAPRPC